MAIDPMGFNSGNIQTFNRYAYANNNPYLYVDPNGLDIVSANAVNNAHLIRYINSRARGLFSFNAKNQLQVDRLTGKTGYSEYYRDRLIAAIKHTDSITLDISRTYTDPAGNVLDVDKKFGGGVTIGSKKGGDQRVIISGTPNIGVKDTMGNPLSSTPADILGHELLEHAIERMTGVDSGKGVKNENKMRAQIKGGQQRKAEPGH